MTPFESGARRLLVVGPMGSGKSSIVRDCALRDPDLVVLSADPGNPAFGPPAAVSAARFHRGGWEVLAVEPLGSLDALRFRLPLALAVRRLCGSVDATRLVVDAPGVSRGVAASETISALVATCGIDAILAVGDASDALDLVGVPVTVLPKPPDARPGGDARRRDHRSSLWAAFLDGAEMLPIGALEVVDQQPGSGLQGRVAVVTSGAVAIGLGVVADGTLRWTRTAPGEARGVLLRDAVVREERVQTAPRAQPASNPEPRSPTSPRIGKPRVVVPIPMERIASARLSIVGTWFDDPMWLLRLDHRRRCLAFDLGEVRRLPTRIVHEMQDVFVSHAHLDHVRDFLWLIRRRLGTTVPCRIVGPPGFAQRAHHMINACTWDRVEDRGPQFVVVEVHDTTLRTWSLQVGSDRQPELLGDVVAPDRVVLRDDRFVVRAIELDHHMPVLAFSVEECARFDVRPDVLHAHGWAPGNWLGELKALASRGAWDEPVAITPDDVRTVRELADVLLLRRPGERFVYATDLADHAENRSRLVEFARDADVLVCEAAFREHDREQAERTGHLTARACGEIATEANVRWLIPFHPSSRYHEDWPELLAEVRAACDRVAGGFRARGETDL